MSSTREAKGRGPSGSGPSRPGPLRADLAREPVYAFSALAETRARLAAEGRRILDFSVGEPHEETPEFLRAALIAAVPARTSYPPTHGTAELRQAAAGWVRRRFGVSLDPETEILGTLGAKEVLYSLPSVVVEVGKRDVVLVPDPAYPVYATGARMAGAEVVHVPLRPEVGFLPDLSGLSETLLARTALLWTNYPNNPTGATAPLVFHAEAAALARAHGFWLASDEAYVDIHDGAAPPSALETGTENVLAIHTLSKRSALAGFRTGFLAGDARLVSALRRIRPSQGIASPAFVQAAAAQAWADDAHVGAMRVLYGQKRALLRSVLERRGAQVAPSDAGLFLFFRPPGSPALAFPTATARIGREFDPGPPDQNLHPASHALDAAVEACLERLLSAGLLAMPGSAFGGGGRGWIRLALVPTLEECREAARILGERL